MGPGSMPLKKKTPEKVNVYMYCSVLDTFQYKIDRICEGGADR